MIYDFFLFSIFFHSMGFCIGAWDLQRANRYFGHIYDELY